MSVDEKYRPILEVLAKANGREGLDLGLLADEIRKELGADDTFGKFMELVKSLRDIIPNEKQRYNAAIKALSTTAGVSRDDILQSSEERLEELDSIEKEGMFALSGLRDELSAMDSRSKAVKSEVAKLREKISELEHEDEMLLSGMAALEHEVKRIDDSVRKVFRDAGDEIVGIKRKIEQFSAEEVNSEPEPALKKSGEIGPKNAREDFEIEPKVASAEKEAASDPLTPPDPIEGDKDDYENGCIETEEISEAPDMKKECRVCGELMHFLAEEEKWKCYNCGRAESRENATTAELVEEETGVVDTPLPEEKELSKECPMCGGRMNLHGDQGIWMCYSCGHEELGTGAARKTPKSEAVPEIPEDKSIPVARPAASHKSVHVATAPSGKRRSARKKTCPVCHKQMNMHEEERTWKCPSCDYQRREF